MDTRNWQLKLDVEKREDVDVYNHVYFPTYLNCYEDAARNIFFRILRNEKEQETVEGKYSYASRRDIINILSFMGERGSGKTTAMREFCQILQNMNIDAERNWWLNRSMPDSELLTEISKKKTYFKVLDPIDASSLEAKEDLFELILAAIFKEYTSSINSALGESRERVNIEIMERFGKIIEGYHAIKNVRNEDFGDSYISRLKYMSSSIDIRKEINALVERLLAEWRGEKDNSLLIIAIDDLDLNLVNGYEMLEQLHKYFANHNIVILLAVDYKQMGIVCKTHYINQFLDKKCGNDEEITEHCGKLAKDYMLKVFPLDARVYMPDMKYRDFFVVTESENGKSIKEITDKKKFVMKKTAERMGFFYDILGLKRHFATPETVRELVDYNQFLDSLNQSNYAQWENVGVTDEERRQKILEYNGNYERFIWDIRTRMAKKLLNEKQQKFLGEILKSDLERRAAVFCEKTWEELGDKSMLLVYKGSSDSNEEYVYGDLIKAIHDFGRKNSSNKDLVKCIIAIFTTEMTREKVCFLYSPDSKEKDNAYKKLKGFLGKSFNNKWLQSFIARMENNYFYSFNDAIEISRLNLAFAIDVDDALDNCINSPKITKKVLAELLNKITTVKIVPTLEVLLMLMVIYNNDMEKDGQFIDLDIEYGIYKEDANEKKCLIVKSTNRSGKLDIMGFVEKTLDYETKYKKQQEDIVGAMYRMILQYFHSHGILKISTEEENIIKTEIKQWVKRTSIHSKIKWENHDVAAFPFYDFDISYNIIKRLTRAMEKETQTSIPKEKCYDYIKKIYMEIGNLLKRECAEYGNYFYYENYISCPYVEAFINADKYLNPEFPKMLGNTLANVLSPVLLRPIDDIED